MPSRRTALSAHPRERIHQTYSQNEILATAQSIISDLNDNFTGDIFQDLNLQTEVSCTATDLDILYNQILQTRDSEMSYVKILTENQINVNLLVVIIQSSIKKGDVKDVKRRKGNAKAQQQNESNEVEKDEPDEKKIKKDRTKVQKQNDINECNTNTVDKITSSKEFSGSTLQNLASVFEKRISAANCYLELTMQAPLLLNQYIYEIALAAYRDLFEEFPEPSKRSSFKSNSMTSDVTKFIDNICTTLLGFVSRFSDSNQHYENMILFLENLPGLCKVDIDMRNSIGVSCYTHLFKAASLRSSEEFYMMIMKSLLVFLTGTSSEFSRDLGIQFARIGLEAHKVYGKEAIQILLQHCFLKAPERADPRAFLAETIFKLWNTLPKDWSKEILQQWSLFLPKLAKHPKASIRLFVVEVAQKFLFLDVDSDRSITWGLIENIFFTRVKDRTPGIRSKVFAGLSSIFETQQSNNSVIVTITNMLENEPSIYQRLNDEKSMVRKSALQFFGTLCENFLPSMEHATPDTLLRFIVYKVTKIFSVRCSDVVPTIRKLCIQFLTKFVHIHVFNKNCDICKLLLETWVQYVLPRVLDAESAVEESAIEAVYNIMLKQRKEKSSDDTAAKFIIKMSKPGMSSTGCYISKAFTKMASKGDINESDIQHLQDLASDSDGKEEILSLLSIIVENLPQNQNNNLKLIKAESVVDNILNGHRGVGTFRLLSRIIRFVHKGDRGKLTKVLLSILETEEITDLSLIPEVTKILRELGPEDGLWEKLISTCNQTLKNNILETQKEHVYSNEVKNRILKALVLVGEISSLHLSASTWNHLLSIVVNLHAILGTGSSTNKYIIPGIIRAHTVTALGKLVLHNASLNRDQLARRCLSIFMRELESGNSVTRNNACLILCDMLRGFTSLVEVHIGRISERLRDTQDFIRRQCLGSIGSLLQEDFLKWRSGALLLRILSCLSDTNEETRKLAVYCVKNVLNHRYPQLTSIAFIELIYFLNECTEHSSYNQFPQTKTSLIELESQWSETQRYRIYQILLECMRDEYKVNIPSKICREILLYSIETEDDVLVKPTFENVIKDALYLLRCNEVTSLVKRKNGKTGNETEGNDMNEVTNNTQESQPNNDDTAQTSARQKVTSQVAEIDMLENTTPILLELRHKLLERRHKLVGHVVQCLHEILKQYVRRGGDELVKVLKGDKQFAKELEYEHEEKRKIALEERAMKKKKRMSQVKVEAIISRDPSSMKDNAKRRTDKVHSQTKRQKWNENEKENLCLDDNQESGFKSPENENSKKTQRRQLPRKRETEEDDTEIVFSPAEDYERSTLKKRRWSTALGMSSTKKEKDSVIKLEPGEFVTRLEF